MAVPELTSIDGRITDTAEARISAADDGLLRGDGVFEVIRLYTGRPFALGEHLDRLERSAAALELPVERERFGEEISGLLAEFGEHDAQLRLVVTRGGRHLAFSENLPEYADWENVRLATVTYSPSVILNGVKSLSYAANMESTRLAKGRGADEAVLVRPDGVVLEAPTSTIFWVSDGELRTPALEVGILASITRDRLVRELDVAEGEYTVDELLDAQEVFLASTVREVQAVSEIDGRQFSQDGERTREAVEVFGRVVAEEMRVSAQG